MKEVEKNEIKRLSDRLDAIRHQQAELSLVESADKYITNPLPKSNIWLTIRCHQPCYS